EKSLNILKSENDNAVFSINTFPYFNKDYYLSLGSYDFDKHSLIVGASGSGKSKFIEIFIDKMSKMGLHQNYRVIVIDPHASMAEDMGHIPVSININFKNDSSDLFPSSNDVTAATELSAILFKSLMADQFNAKVERVLRFSLYVLYSADRM